MTASSILLGVAGALGVFAFVALLLWLIYRGVERELVSGKESWVASRVGITFFACVNAALHLNDDSRWEVAFLVIVALFCIAMTWREWRREQV